MTPTDVVAARRPHRADARRNFDAVLAAAAEAFTEPGGAASLGEIARRAGVGIATLYRHFPTRDDLIECVYTTSVDAVVRYGRGLDQDDPGALEDWLRRFATHMATKHALTEMLTRESEAYLVSREAIYGFAEPLFARARQLGAVRADVGADDVMRLVFAVTGGTYTDDAQRDRAVRIVLDGIRPQPAVID